MSYCSKPTLDIIHENIKYKYKYKAHLIHDNRDIRKLNTGGTVHLK